MNSLPKTLRPDEPRLESALQACVRAIEAGEQLGLDVLRERFGDLAGELHECLQALAVVHQAGAAMRPAEVFHLSDPEPLGDFRIVREVGRGGMGVVYEARQLSLGRRVALKVLPFAAALDARQLQRFKNEATAAAHLNHPHIVPVFGVGTERGVHYYAMQFIDGQPLTELIRERQALSGVSPDGEPLPPTFVLTAPKAGSTAQPGTRPDTSGPQARQAYHRQVAELGAQAAEALEHAHQVGVVHRDIKPGNLMLDGQGKLWVTDFGLARLNADANLTRTGDLLGTARYMSPEQALGLHNQLDHRSDVYSLGATLYELLALRPAFPGQDRHEVLRRIVNDDPAAPRKLDGRIPLDLETVVLKAMAKEPAERYATAGEFAADLKRFLADEAVKAHRPTLAQHLGRLGRRYRRVVQATFLFLILAVCGLTAAVVLINDARNGERKKAGQLKEKSDELEGQIAQTNLESDRKEKARDLAFDAVEKLYTRGVQELLDFFPHHEIVQGQFLRLAIEEYQKLCTDTPNDYRGRLQVAMAQARLGSLQHRIGQLDESAGSLKTAIAALEQLRRERPDEMRPLITLAEAHNNLGHTHVSRVDDELALSHFRQAARLQEEAIRREPNNPDSQAVLNSIKNNTHTLLTRMGKPDDAMREEAFASQMRLIRDHPKNPRYKVAFVSQMNNIAKQLTDQGKSSDAVPYLRAGLELLDDLDDDAAKNPLLASSIPDYRSVLAQSLGRALFELDQLPEAEMWFAAALATREERFRDYPRTLSYGHQLAGTLDTLGVVKRLNGKDPSQEFRRAGEVLEQLRRAHPNDQASASRLRNNRSLLGDWLFHNGKYAEAEPVYRRGVELSALVQKRWPERTPESRQAELTNRLAQAQMFQNKTDAALKTLDEVENLLRPFLADKPTSLICEEMAKCHINRAVMLRTTNAARAMRELREAIAVLSRFSRPNQVEDQRVPLQRARALINLGVIRWSVARERESEELVEQGCAVLEQLARDKPRFAEAFRELGGAWQNRASLMLDKKDVRGARKAMESAVEAQVKALELSPYFHHSRQYLRRHYRLLIQCLISLRDHEAVAKRGRELSKHLDGDWETAYEAAQALSVAYTLVGMDKNLDPSLQGDLRKEYADKMADQIDESLRRGKGAPAVAPTFAWFLVAEVDPALRAPARAIKLAEEALSRRPEAVGNWEALGLARYRNGQFRLALEVAAEARQRSGKELSLVAEYTAALCHARLAEKDEARQCFERGERERQKLGARITPALRRLANETAEALKAIEKPAT